MRLRPRARGPLAVLLVALAWAVAAPAALADGDPASDVLLYQSAFFPYTGPSTGVKAELLGATAAAKRAGFPIRVAVIESTQDLGADPELFGRPQLYARFLDSELLSARYLGVLVVVMPQGFGVAGGGKLIDHNTKFKPRPIAPFQHALAGLRPPHTNDVDTLTSAGVLAVRVVARAAGHPIPGKLPKVTPVTSTPPSPASGGSSGTLELEAGLAVLAIAAIVMIGMGMRRGRPSDPES